jgi:hypothetical protein
MINYKSIAEYQEKIKNIKETYTKEQVDNFLGFTSKKEKIFSLYSIRYKTTNKLLYKGVLTYGYIYKIQYFYNAAFNYFKAWILFSPSSKYEENPKLYSKIAAKLNYFLENPPKKYKHLTKQLLNNENEFSFKELPRDEFNDPIFISTIFIKEKTNPNLNIGINGVMLNRQIAKQILVVPE